MELHLPQPDRLRSGRLHALVCWREGSYELACPSLNQNGCNQFSFLSKTQQYKIQMRKCLSQLLLFQFLLQKLRLLLLKYCWSPFLPDFCINIQYVSLIHSVLLLFSRTVAVKKNLDIRFLNVYRI